MALPALQGRNQGGKRDQCLGVGVAWHAGPLGQVEYFLPVH
ncbi:MAG: hypothetical protein ACK55Z_13580 [bacterium]